MERIIYNPRRNPSNMYTSIEIIFNNVDSILDQSFQEEGPRIKPLCKKYKDTIIVKEIDDNDIKGDLSCAICQDNFVADNRKITLLGCHVFCTECITPWLEKYNDICPICRKKVCSDKGKKDP